MNEAKKTSWATVAFGLGGSLFFLVSLLGLILVSKSAFKQYKFDRAVESWTVVEGKVVETDLKQKKVSDGEGGTDTGEIPFIKYRYEVEGTEYHSSERGDTYWRENKARMVLEPYESGRAIKVYFDPANPNSSTIKLGNPGKTARWDILKLLAATLASLLWLAVMVPSIRHR